LFKIRIEVTNYQYIQDIQNTKDKTLEITSEIIPAVKILISVTYQTEKILILESD